MMPVSSDCTSKLAQMAAPATLTLPGHFFIQINRLQDRPRDRRPDAGPVVLVCVPLSSLGAGLRPAPVRRAARRPR